MTDLTRHFQDMAKSMFVAYKALLFNETPVACIVKNKQGDIVSIGYNYTNTSLNGTQHAEFIAMQRFKDKDVDYTQLELYVTVEPCIMCASFLRQLSVGKVYYGCGNDRFGGTGTVLSVNNDVNLGEDGIYESIGGIMRTEAIQLLRNFYIQENESAPQPKIKKNKEIENKEFPKNEFKFSEEEFVENYGEERREIYFDGFKELTPVVGQGYSVHDLIDSKELKKIPFLEQELGEITQDQINEFCDLFFNITNNSEINYSKSIRKYNAKKRHLEE